jgi:uncharacterized protein YbjT (DUF2867 family)
MKSVVTGAYSFTGRFIAKELLARGEEVVSFSRSPDREGIFQGRVPSEPLQFDDLARLTRSLQGASTLYNTYWVRFNHGQVSFDQAIRNTQILLQASKAAGIQKFVHISVTNPSESSPLAYYRGKAVLERMVQESGLSFAIIRPTLIFGEQDLLINNIAWVLRRFHVFGVFGSGNYRVQPVAGEDVARLAVDAGQQRENKILDAAGPEIYRFDDFVRTIAKTLGARSWVVHWPRPLVYGLSKLGGYFVRDVVLTPEEINGLMQELLITHGPATGKKSFNEWVSRNSNTLGQEYRSELRRNFNE